MGGVPKEPRTERRDDPKWTSRRTWVSEDHYSPTGTKEVTVAAVETYS